MSPLPSSQSTDTCLLIKIPQEVQVNLLSYLRAFDMASVQQTCRYYAAPPLMDAIVRHVAERVYPAALSEGYDQQPVLYQRQPNQMTVEHLRNMELVVIARVLSRPEPASGTGFVVSKSWCKAALQWLEVCEQQRQQQQQQTKKKLNRKQRVRNRRLSDASPPWPNCNADILCVHANLVCMSNKSARARRRLIDRQSWKAISNLYPDSTPLEALVGECVMCRTEAQSAKQDAELKDQVQLQKRKKPLDRPAIRQFYTRTRGVPTQAVKQGATATGCPLEDGVYFILPRVWCQGWRRYIKTGEIGTSNGNSGSLPRSSFSSCPLPPAPDTTCLLCAAHRLPLLPAHLEAYLYRHTDALFPNTSDVTDGAAAPGVAAPPPAAAARAVPVGQVEPLDQAVLQALQAAGLGPADVARQLQAMRILEHERMSQASSSTGAASVHYSPPDDWVEILTQDEYTALLEEQPWTGSAPDPAEGVSFAVRGGAVDKFLPTSPCRDCHPSARRYCCTSASNGSDLKRTVSKQKKHRGGSKVSRPGLSPMHLEY